MALTSEQEALRRRRVLRKAHNLIKRLAFAAVEATTPVRTGALRASTAISFRGNTCTVRQLFYGKFLEFGTRFIEARRFMEKAIRQLKNSAQVRAIERELGLSFRFMYFGRQVG